MIQICMWFILSNWDFRKHTSHDMTYAPSSSGPTREYAQYSS